MARSSLRGSHRRRLVPSAGRREAIFGLAENSVAASRDTAVHVLQLRLQQMGWTAAGAPTCGKRRKCQGRWLPLYGGGWGSRQGSYTMWGRTGQACQQLHVPPPYSPTRSGCILQAHLFSLRNSIHRMAGSAEL